MRETHFVLTPELGHGGLHTGSGRRQSPKLEGGGRAPAAPPALTRLEAWLCTCTRPDTRRSSRGSGFER